MSAKWQKQAKATEKPSGTKTPAIGVQPPIYGDQKAAWRISKIQMTAPYGWHVMTAQEVAQVKQKLETFEKSTWKELFVDNKHRNHRISAADLKCPIARKWMKDNMPDQDYLWTLRLSGAERIWGILSQDAYQIVFWDPDNLIWEVPRN